MIPKIIHYCWLSGDPYPEKIRKCMESWEKIIPDYKFILWDWNKCKEEKILIPWVKEAFENKKYAFASDYIRLYAIYKYGGIYLDTDIEVIKPFDSLLHLPYFIGREAKGDRVEIAAFGAEKNTEWIKICMEYYVNRNFLKKDGELDMRVMPDIIFERINPNYIIKNISTINSFEHNNSIFNQFPNDWFCANIYLNPNDQKPTYFITNSTYCVHHFANSWLKMNKLEYIRHKYKSYFYILSRIYYRIITKFKSYIFRQ